MKITGVGKIEYEVREQFMHNGFEIRCVRDFSLGCGNCVFGDDDLCGRLACCTSERGDGLACHFVFVRRLGGGDDEV